MQFSLSICCNLSIFNLSSPFVIWLSCICTPFNLTSVTLQLSLLTILPSLCYKISESYGGWFLDRFLLVAVLPSSLPLMNDLSSPKSPLERLPMLSKSPDTLTPLSPIQSATNSWECAKAALIQGCNKEEKPLLTAVHRKKRLAFALKHREWTVEDWKRVMWSNKTKINRIGSDGKQWVWKKAGVGWLRGRYKEQWNLEVGTSWYGVVWAGMVWENLLRLRENGC